MFDRLLTMVSLLVLVQGCAPTALVPADYAGPTATVVDTASGGGSDGGVFFVLAQVDGKMVRNSLDESSAASQGRGFLLTIQHVQRRVFAGKTRLKLLARVAYAAPIQEIFRAGRIYSVQGEVEVDLKRDRRYRVNGVLDAFRREVWLEEAESGEIVGQKIIGAPDAEAAAATKAESTFTCCNLRYDGDWISDANFATLPFIPAGARISVNDYGRHRASVLIEGRPFRIGHDYGREQESTQQYVRKVVVSEDPKRRIATFPATVQAAIGAGKVMVGMTKEQVRISLGYPRTDKTRSLDSSEWAYSTSYGGDEYFVIWGTDELVKDIDGLRRVKRLVVHDE